MAIPSHKKAVGEHLLPNGFAIITYPKERKLAQQHHLHGPAEIT